MQLQKGVWKRIKLKKKQSVKREEEIEKQTGLMLVFSKCVLAYLAREK